MDIKIPGLQDRVLSKRNDAHIYVDKKKCSPFQKWQFVFVSSRIRRRFSVEGSRLSCHRGHILPPMRRGIQGVPLERAVAPT